MTLTKIDGGNSYYVEGDGISFYDHQLPSESFGEFFARATGRLKRASASGAKGLVNVGPATRCNGRMGMGPDKSYAVCYECGKRDWELYEGDRCRNLV